MRKGDNVKKLKEIFCRHNYVKVGFKEEELNNIMFSMRLYKCRKCGKEVWIDGRKDYLGN